MEEDSRDTLDTTKCLLPSLRTISGPRCFVTSHASPTDVRHAAKLSRSEEHTSELQSQDGIFAISSSRQTKYKFHTNIFPWLVRNWKRHIEAMRLSFRLSFATCRASVGEAVDVAKHLGPKIVLGERS